MNWSKKSAEAIVAARRRAEREGELEDMSLENARHQKPERSGRSGRRRGEAESATGRDEAESARRDREGSGWDVLLRQALARENLVLAWKRVKTNRSSTLMNLNFSNRPVRTRMPGGVGGVDQQCCSPLSRFWL